MEFYYEYGQKKGGPHRVLPEAEPPVREFPHPPGESRSCITVVGLLSNSYCFRIKSVVLVDMEVSHCHQGSPHLLNGVFVVWKLWIDVVQQPIKRRQTVIIFLFVTDVQAK